MSDPTTYAAPSRATIDGVKVKSLLVQVPTLVYHGWKCISQEPSLVVNVPDRPYNREEPDGTLPYDWCGNDG